MIINFFITGTNSTYEIGDSSYNSKLTGLHGTPGGSHFFSVVRDSYTYNVSPQRTSREKLLGRF